MSITAGIPGLPLFPGTAGEAPGDEPTATFSGPERDFRLGVATTAVGDTNDDGRPDFVSMSHYGGTEFSNIGRPFFVRSTTVEVPAEPVGEGEEPPEPLVEETYELIPLNMPNGFSGARFGTDVAFVGDVDGDGWLDAMVTARIHLIQTSGFEAEELWFYRGTENGLSQVGERAPAFGDLSRWDLLRGVEGIGDFNGDGHDDFVVLIGNDERPQEFNENYAAPEPCVARLNDQGGAYIFLGGPDRFDLEPDFVYWGLGQGLVTEMVRGGYDFNGDGLSDIAIGAWRRDIDGRNDTGSVTLSRVEPIRTPVKSRSYASRTSSISVPKMRIISATLSPS